MSEGSEPAVEQPPFALRDAANDCRHYALTGEPPIDTLTDWADLFDRAADALEAADAH